MSFLLSEGHAHARKYPISTIWIEAEIARERVNGRLATEAILLHGVVVSVLSPDGKGVKNLNKMLRDLIDGR